MVSKQNYQENLDPPPPRDISKENLGLWVGWTYKSDRQVVREAASKGHISLAGNFLSLRKNVETSEINEFIREEVFLWVDELLSRKLILSVLRILENIGTDPVHELQNLFYKTPNKEVREYVGNYLKEKTALSQNMDQLWTFLNIIIDNKALTHPNNLNEDTIENLDNKSQKWKDYTAAKLFLNTHDNRLIPLVKMKALWNLLLTSNETHLLRAWIHSTYSTTSKTLNIPEALLLVMKSFPISDEMIEDLETSNMPSDSLEKIVNDLAIYGIFIGSDKNNFVNILRRVNRADSLANVYQIVKQKSSNLSLHTFTSMLVDYCLENRLLTVLNACTKDLDISDVASEKNSPHLDLMMDFRHLVTDFEDTKLRNNIVHVSEYLAEGDLPKYFCDNPRIFLSWLVLNHEISIEKSLEDKSLVLHNMDVYECLINLMDEFDLVSALYKKKIQGVQCSITYLDLIERHLKIDVKKAYSFHFQCSPPPHFNSPELKKYAYSKKLNYTFYLKQCRPSIASKRFFLDILRDSKSIDEDSKRQAVKKVHKIAVSGLRNAALISSCVSFLEMIGFSSESLRVTVEVGNILCQSGMDEDYVKAILMNAENDPRTVRTILEETVLKLMDFGELQTSGSEFVKSVKLYEVVAKFSSLHRLPLPEGFLKNLTQHNLWFPFLLYAQINNYPVDQMKELCPNFKNPYLLEHIVHSVMHDIQVDETNVLMKERDSRKYLLSKLGVRRTLDQAPGATGSLRSRSTLSGSTSSSMGSEVLEIDISNTKVTLLQILIRCHNSTDPPRALLQACQLYKNPLLAILATSYEPDSVVTNWLTWLAVSTDLYEIFTNFEALAASEQQVTELLDKCMRNRFPNTLLQSFIIFIPNNPLSIFVEFLINIIRHETDISYLQQKLEKFKSLKSNRRVSVLSQTDYEMTYLKNKVWIEKTAIHLLRSALIYNTKSHHDQLEFVKLLCELKIEDYLSCNTPRFKTVLRILETLFDTDVKLNLVEYLYLNREKESVQDCIDKLVKKGFYDDALQIAQCSELDTDLIVLKKWQHNFENRRTSIDRFLWECDKEFVDLKVSADYVISFYKERASVDDIERYYLLKFSHKWAFEHNLPITYELEKKKIISFIQLHDVVNFQELVEIDGGTGHTTYKEMCDILDTINATCEKTSEYGEQLEVLMNRALDEGYFWFALKLERLFGCVNNDLDILKLCHDLAEGLVLPEEVNVEQNKLFARAKEIQRISYRRRSLSYKSVNVSSDKGYLELIEEDPESSAEDTLGLIHSLIERLTHGAELAYRIFMKYRISCNIEVPYDIVVSNTDPLRMLKDALEDDCSNKLEVIHDFLEVFDNNKDDVTDFVCEQLVRAASRYSKSKMENFTMWDVRVVEQFHLVLKLFKDECSTLGHKLYNFASAVHQEQITADLDFKISEMSLVVELLIAAHNCFTADCNMEGISNVLKKCRVVISHLLTVRSWKLIVRLLTGIGRYNELNFVFHILKENDQFEFLLSKGSKRDEKLKLACVDYLKRYCPQNKELYKMVALHFTLYSEIALVWEREAQGFIKNLVAVARAEMQNNRLNPDTAEFILLTKSDGTTLLLDKAMENYVHASEFHIQGEKLTNAMNAAKLAELIALQKSLLRVAANNDTVPCLLNLTNAQIAKLMSKILDFHQSYVLVQAYNYQPDWPHIIFEQAILSDNIAYFDQYNATMGIDEQLVQDISRRFLSNSVKSRHGLLNMRHIVDQLTSVNVKYRLASELGFTRLVADMISEAEISHLRDTVWKQGYKS